MRYECLEPGCGWSVRAAGEEELLGAVEAHMAAGHNTFELEDVILANASSDEGAGAEGS